MQESELMSTKWKIEPLFFYYELFFYFFYLYYIITTILIKFKKNLKNYNNFYCKFESNMLINISLFFITKFILKIFIFNNIVFIIIFIIK